MHGPGYHTVSQWRLRAGCPRAVARLRQLAPAAARAIWWPFTQHAALDALPGAVTTVDARCGEHLITLQPGAGAGAAGAPLCPEISPGALLLALFDPQSVHLVTLRAGARAGAAGAHVFPDQPRGLALGHARPAESCTWRCCGPAPGRARPARPFVPESAPGPSPGPACPA